MDIPKNFSEQDATTQARILVHTYMQDHGVTVRLSEIKVTWFNYTLGGWKAMLCIDNECDYYEVTFDNVNAKYYLDKYEPAGYTEYDAREILITKHQSISQSPKTNKNK